MERKLYRSRNDRVLFGVCGGMGNYFMIDPIIIRIIFAIITIMGGSGILLYLIFALLIPLEPVGYTEANNDAMSARERISHNYSGAMNGIRAFMKEAKEEWHGLFHNSKKAYDRVVDERDVFAIVLICLGFIALIDNVFPLRISVWAIIWPAFIISAGVYFLWKNLMHK